MVNGSYHFPIEEWSKTELPFCKLWLWFCCLFCFFVGIYVCFIYLFFLERISLCRTGSPQTGHLPIPPSWWLVLTSLCHRAWLLVLFYHHIEQMFWGVGKVVLDWNLGPTGTEPLSCVLPQIEPFLLAVFSAPPQQYTVCALDLCSSCMQHVFIQWVLRSWSEPVLKSRWCKSWRYSGSPLVFKDGNCHPHWGLRANSILV